MTAQSEIAFEAQVGAQLEAVRDLVQEGAWGPAQEAARRLLELFVETRMAVGPGLPERVYKVRVGNGAGRWNIRVKAASRAHAEMFAQGWCTDNGVDLEAVTITILGTE